METKLPRGILNNNPGNIRPNSLWKWDGQGPEDTSGNMGSYLTFITPEYGIRAMIRDVRMKRKRGLDTIYKILSAYAPPSDNNDVMAYAHGVCARIGAMLQIQLEPNDPLPPDTIPFRIAMAKAQTRVENGSGGPYGRTDYWYSDNVFAKGAALEEGVSV